MPFTSISKTGPAGREPDVKIFFHGLLLLRSEDGKTCEAGVNHAGFRHVLSVEARTKTPNRPDVIHMRHFGNLNFRQPGMSIQITGAGPDPNAFKFVSSAQIDHANGDSAPEEDFRWIINLEGGLFHGDEITSTVFGTQHVIRLEGGEYYFYTARRARPGLKFERKGGGKKDKTFRRIGSVIGARVFLNDNQSVVMRWSDGVQEDECVLTLSKPQSGVSHEIYIENSPLYEPPTTLRNRPRHSELLEYYKVIPGIIGAARFNLEPSEEVTPGLSDEGAPFSSGSAKYDSERGSPSIPCQSVVLDGPLS